MASLTVIVPCHNEEKMIGDCLACLRFADELLVVDSFSTDRTLEIARQFPVRILQHEYVNSATQKNWALQHAASEWILIVDCDERVTPELADEIQAVLYNPGYDGYWIRRRNFFMGKEIRHAPASTSAPAGSRRQIGFNNSNSGMISGPSRSLIVTDFVHAAGCSTRKLSNGVFNSPRRPFKIPMSGWYFRPSGSTRCSARVKVSPRTLRIWFRGKAPASVSSGKFCSIEIFRFQCQQTIIQ